MGQALDGPHYYEIVDQGGLLVAIAADTNTPNTIKFSTDEGRCWHSYKFTNKSIIFTKLLTEPGNAAMSVSVWGYTEDDHIWRVHTIDFSIVVPELCKTLLLSGFWHNFSVQMYHILFTLQAQMKMIMTHFLHILITIRMAAC